MHALDLKGLVPFEKTLNMLVFWRGVEEGPVYVLGQTRESLPLPLLVVGARFGKALGPGEVDGAKPCRVWLLLGGVDEVSWILDIWQRMHRISTVSFDGSMALSQRVFLVIAVAEGVLVSDIHFRKGQGIGDSLENSPFSLPEPVSVNVKSFIDRPNLKTDLVRRNRLSLRREALANNQHFTLWLGHAHVEHRVLAKLGCSELPHVDL